MPSLRILSLVAAFCLLLGACSDGSSSTTTAPSDGSESPIDDGETDEDANASPDDDDANANDDGDMNDGDMDDGDSAAIVGPYCALAAQAEARSAAFDPAAATPAEAEEFYRSMLALTDQALETAPAAVADSLAVQRDALVQTIELLDAAGWDVLGSVEGLSAIYENPEFLTASDVLAEFDSDGCGFASGEDLPDVPPVEEPVDVPAEFAAYSAASFEASETDGLEFDADPASVEAYYRGLLVSLDELLRLAPPELAVDLETIRANFLEVVGILEGVEWDVDAGYPLLQEWTADPEVSDPMDAAIDRVEGFDAEMCGIFY